MSHTIQTTLALPVVFGFLSALLLIGPQMYSNTNNSAVISYQYLCEQSKNKFIYKVSSIHVNQETAVTVYTSPERLMYAIDSFRDSVELITEGVQSLW